MKTATVNGVKLEYEEAGSGEPIVFIHGASVAETFVPLMKEPALARYRRIRYHRRGYGGSEHPGRTTNFHEQAADAAALVRHLGIGAAHVVGHSYGGLTALRLALDSPSLVATLSLLEPPMLATPMGPKFAEGSLGPVSPHRCGRPNCVLKFARSWRIVEPPNESMIAIVFPWPLLPAA